MSAYNCGYWQVYATPMTRLHNGSVNRVVVRVNSGLYRKEKLTEFKNSKKKKNLNCLPYYQITIA